MCACLLFSPGTLEELIGQHRLQGMFTKPAPQINSFHAADPMAVIVYMLAPHGHRRRICFGDRWDAFLDEPYAPIRPYESEKPTAALIVIARSKTPAANAASIGSVWTTSPCIPASTRSAIPIARRHHRVQARRIEFAGRG